MDIEIYLGVTSQKIKHRGVANTYQKGSLFCVYVPNLNKVYKYPIDHIWRVEEDYTDGDKVSLSNE